jgi:hypothetical protein
VVLGLGYQTREEAERSTCSEAALEGQSGYDRECETK